ncbi:homoserine kinase [Aquisediminimonas profunda]|uniref:homoserine kinase n=1 Tax=Aquisediminimonas profunda TaxID=1550733 RepID=UPI001C62A82F|nr:homoserine kinase [Aquisediminimonas profunda]
MAVYTHIPAEDMAELVHAFGAGSLLSAKGIAEGVENSNYLLDTTDGRFILTVYEKRVDTNDLPFFLSLIDHLADNGCPVPRARHTESGAATIVWHRKTIALIEFAEGLSVSHPTAAQAHAVGAALGQVHKAAASFKMSRPNSLGPEGWFDLAERCGEDLDAIQIGLRERIAKECTFLNSHWPATLPKSVIHADLFPDNVLMVGSSVSALIDFYFACTEVRAWDVAITHAAWSFQNDGTGFDAAIGDAILDGYEETFGLTDDERAAFSILARGACLRFLLTRAWDWLNTPTDALVTRKDPLAFLRRLEHYAAQ